MTRICVNFSTVYNDTLVAKGLNSLGINWKLEAVISIQSLAFLVYLYHQFQEIKYIIIGRKSLKCSSWIHWPFILNAGQHGWNVGTFDDRVHPPENPNIPNHIRSSQGASIGPFLFRRQFLQHIRNTENAKRKEYLFTATVNCYLQQ